MASPEEMGAYYEKHPDPDDPSTWREADSFDDAQADFEEAMGPPPEPPQIPGPPSPGAGMAAARIGDLCAHGGTIIGRGCPRPNWRRRPGSPRRR